MIGYRICRYSPGTADEERAALTEDCLNQNILTQANITRAQAPGNPYYFLGNASDVIFRPPKVFYHVFQLPAGLVCDNVQWKCVIQMRWLTGNSCSPPEIPTEFKYKSLSTCSDKYWPEFFFNCADIVILPPGSPPAGSIDQSDDPSWPKFSPALIRLPEGVNASSVKIDPSRYEVYDPSMKPPRPPPNPPKSPKSPKSPPPPQSPKKVKQPPPDVSYIPPSSPPPIKPPKSPRSPPPSPPPPSPPKKRKPPPPSPKKQRPPPPLSPRQLV